MPVDCKVSHGSPNIFQGPKTREGDYYTKWVHASVTQQQLYNSTTETLLGEIKVDSETLSYRNTKCTDIPYCVTIDSLCHDLQGVLIETVDRKRGGNFIE